MRRNVTSGRYVGATRDAKTQKWLIPADSLDRFHDITHVDAEVFTEPATDAVETWGGAPAPVPASTHPITAALGGPVMLSVQDAAGVLGISEYAVREAVRRGELRAYPWGAHGALVVPLAEIRRLAGL